MRGTWVLAVFFFEMNCISVFHPGQIKLVYSHYLVSLLLSYTISMSTAEFNEVCSICREPLKSEGDTVEWLRCQQCGIHACFKCIFTAYLHDPLKKQNEIRSKIKSGEGWLNLSISCPTHQGHGFFTDRGDALHVKVFPECTPKPWDMSFFWMALGLAVIFTLDLCLTYVIWSDWWSGNMIYRRDYHFFEYLKSVLTLFLVVRLRTINKQKNLGAEQVYLLGDINSIIRHYSCAVIIQNLQYFATYGSSDVYSSILGFVLIVLAKTSILGYLLSLSQVDVHRLMSLVMRAVLLNLVGLMILRTHIYILFGFLDIFEAVTWRRWFYYCVDHLRYTISYRYEWRFVSAPLPIENVSAPVQ